MSAWRRHAPVWCLALVGATAQAAGPAQVADVRVGLHPDHTRIVIELDGPAGHRVERSDSGRGELSVRLDAGGERRRVVSRSPLVSTVVVEPAGARGAVAKISLREPGLEFSEMVLTKPPRIVIDVRRPARTAAAAASRPAPTAAAKAAPPEQPGEEVVAAPPATAKAAPAGPDPIPGATPALPRLDTVVTAPDRAPAPRDPFAAPSGYAALVEAQRDTGTAATGPDEAPADASPPAATAPPTPSVRPPPVAAAPAAPPASPTVLAAPPAGPGLAPDAERRLGEIRGSLAALDPAPIALLLGGLLAVWFVYRQVVAARTRRLALAGTGEAAALFGDAPADSMSAGATLPAPGRRSDPAPPGPLFEQVAAAEVEEYVQPMAIAVAAEDRDEPEASPEPYVAKPVIEASSYVVEPVIEASAYVVEAADPEPVPDPVLVAALPETAPVAAQPQLALVPPPESEDDGEEEKESVPVVTGGWRTLAVPGSAAEATASGDTRTLEEAQALAAALEQRIGRLETRIEDLLESRQRLERHAAAQNEELRVQRAAIARTQRVLRGVVRSDDTPAEVSPAPPPAAD